MSRGMEDQVQGWKMMIGASNGLLESALEKCDSDPLEEALKTL